MSNVSIKYGNYSFKPVPKIEFSSDIKRSAAGYLMGTVDKISLNGVLFGSGSINDTGSVLKTDNSFNNVLASLTGLKQALEKDFEILDIKCGSTQIYKSDANVTFVDSIDFTNSTNENWLQIIDYTVVISVYNTGTSNNKLISYINDNGYLVSDFVDTYSINTNDESFYEFKPSHKPPFGESFGLQFPSYTVTRNISANGVETKNISALNNAKNFVSGLANSDIHGLNVMLSGLFIYDRATTINQDPINGTYGINDTFAAYSGSSGWADKYTVTSSTTLDSNFNRTVTVDGEVKGLTRYQSDNTSLYSKMIDNTFSTDTGIQGYAKQAWTLASGGFYSYVYPNILNKINRSWSHNTGLFKDLSSLTGCDTTFNMNPVPLSVSIQHDIANGTIQYSLSYDNRPLQVISGALEEELTITDNFSLREYSFVDVFLRTPLAQDIGTYKLGTRSASYSATLPKQTGCPIPDPFDMSPTNTININRKNNITKLTSSFDPSGLRPLSASDLRIGPRFFSQVTESRENYDIVTGKYSYNITWEYYKGFISYTGHIFLDRF